MKRTASILLQVLLLASCGQKAEIQPLRTQGVLARYEASVTDFGMVALIDNGSLKDSASIGVSHGHVPISTKNRFCIGSCTKMFTSVVILKLQEQGLLSINDSIYRYIPNHPYIDSTITVRQLLNHTSGLTDFLKNGFQNEPFMHPEGDFSDKVLYSKIDTVDFEKGSRYRYCNTNYFLLTKIIEKVTVRPYEMNVQKLIIDPLGLKNTFPYHSNGIENLAHPIIDGQDLHDYAKLPSNVLTQGSVNIVSDIIDLNTFIRALLIDRTLLSGASLDAMTSFYDFQGTRSGLGIFESEYGGRTLLGHTGRTVSYISYVFVDQRSGESIIVMKNNANDEIVDKVFEELVGQ